jgi:voltage-gated hydrogen channel 1
MSSSTEPLLGPSHHPPRRSFREVHAHYQQRTRSFLSSHAQHYTVLLFVALDLLGIFADIIINLYQCDFPSSSPTWLSVRDGLGLAGLVFSCIFMLELLLNIWAFGWRYFNSWFHSFDAAVIIAGFVTDVLLHGVLEEIASLVVMLRLWRFFKIIEEIGVGAEEQMEVLEGRIGKLERENEELREEVKRRGGKVGDEEAAV